MILTKNTRLYFKFLLFLWLVAIVLRISFAAWQWESLEAFSWEDIAKAFYIGVRFDGRIAAFMSLPLLVFLFIPFLSRFFGNIRPFLLVFYAIVFGLYILIYIADFAHYAYLNSRVNFAAVGLLEDTKEALGMIWQTYPVIKLLLVLVVIVAILTLCAKSIFNKWTYPSTKTALSHKITSAIATLFVLVILIYGQYGIIYYPLRWSEAYFSGHNQITALGLNPIQNLADTRPQNSYIDNTKQAREAYAATAEYLGVQNPNADSMRYDRFSQTAGVGNKPNIVIIVIESMSTHKSSLMFDELDTTRFLKQLSQESLYFPNYYASARTTARAMFSIITGIPDVNEYFKTSSRDPYTMDQHLVWNDFDGYTKLYMIGGNANWANIRGVMSNNVSGLKIYDEGYWKSPRMDVWGISDHDLLQEANTLLEEQQEPFISLIQLASFHTPFTVPDGIAGLDYTIPDDEYLAKYAFDTKQEYLALKFCDYALKKFFEKAKQSRYYDNTIFIITGDHGMSQVSPSVEQSYSHLALHEFQVPLIIHSPKYFPQAKVMKQTGGHIDIFPTAAGLAGVKVHNTTMGRDLLDPSFGEDRFTFIRRLNRPPLLVSNEYCFSNEYEQAGGGSLYKRVSKDSTNTESTKWELVEGQDSKLYSKLKTINESLWESAIYMLYHNTKARADEATNKAHTE
nr:sulfatase-like hydrolase/transferase [uncultured Helicobacter sp.]